jgi:hypothetical protein
MIFDWTETDVNRGFGPLPASPAFTRRHHDALAAGGRLAGVVQLHLTRDAHGQPAGIMLHRLRELGAILEPARPTSKDVASR